MLYEREAALSAIRDGLKDSEAGLGCALFVLGEAGMGKSTLLGAARELVGPGLPVVSARGAPLESDLPLAYAEQFLGSLSASPDATSVADPLTRRAAAHEAARTRLRQLAEQGPLLVLLDDMHWADADSVSLISFLARRLSNLPIVVIGATRSWPATGSLMAAALAHAGEARIVEASPLSDEASDELLEELLGEMATDQAKRQARELAEGIPLLVIETARLIRSQGAVPASEGGVGSLGTTQRTILLRPLIGVPTSALACVRAASILGPRARLAAVEALVGIDPESFANGIDALIGAGVLLEQVQGRVGFRHDLVQSAVYQDMGPAARAALHTKAFAHYADQADLVAAAPHAVAADLSGDPRAIEAVAEAARLAINAGAVQSGLAQLEVALGLAGAQPADNLLLLYADTLCAVGRPADALAHYSRLLSSKRATGLRSRITIGLARAQSADGHIGDAVATFREVIAEQGATPDARLVPLLVELANAVYERDGPRAALANMASTFGSPKPSEVGWEMATGFWGHCQLECGDGTGLDRIEAAFTSAKARLAASAIHPGSSVSPIAAKVNALLATEQYESCLDLARTAESWLRAGGELRSLVILRGLRLLALLCSGAPLTLLSEAEDLDEELDIGSLWWSRFGSLRVRALVWLGQLSQAAELCAQLDASASGWMAQIMIAAARGELFLASGDAAGASESFTSSQTVAEQLGLGLSSYMWESGAMEAYLGAGEMTRAVSPSPSGPIRGCGGGRVKRGALVGSGWR